MALGKMIQNWQERVAREEIARRGRKMKRQQLVREHHLRPFHLGRVYARDITRAFSIRETWKTVKPGDRLRGPFRDVPIEEISLGVAPPPMREGMEDKLRRHAAAFGMNHFRDLWADAVRNVDDRIIRQCYKAPQNAIAAPPRKRKVKHTASADRIISGLERKGWEKIGAGFFAVAYIHPSKRYVVKVCTHGADAYSAYVEIAKMLPTNPHVPRVYGHKNFGNGVSVTLLEKLKPITEDQRYRALGDLVREALYGKLNAVSKLIDTSRPLFDLVVKMDEVRKKKSLSEDLHMGNMMARADGTLVVTDPFS